MAQVDPKKYFKDLNIQTLKNSLVSKAYEKLRQEVFGVIKQITGAFTTAVSNFTGKITSLLSVANNFISGVKGKFGQAKEIVDSIPTSGAEARELVEGAVSTVAAGIRDEITEGFGEVIQAGSDFVETAKDRTTLDGFVMDDNGIIDDINTSASVLGNAADDLQSTFQGLPGQAEELLSGAVDNISDLD
jgi:phage-related protein